MGPRIREDDKTVLTGSMYHCVPIERRITYRLQAWVLRIQ